ncbi:response regulator transcription factor [Clostridium grantii]|uniref:Stage 0 sporulation protein A homolog n=1 Tax=Clostridium grantii DSM 8605 TaxID=1121316 RepID=A0A1M5WX73_9CLOT|nr:response regulator transcription factor [Clostridium grantii]SHH92199.1 DNA-binding response regulator, OmpR family, contains REC and winged-helix (wHTH) domain [Clostridium grantii DSM 8605]
MTTKDLLIVEDDKAILRILELEFEYEGYTFDTASDGRKALELFEKNNYALILLDLMLPHINGMEVCRKIRKHSPVPIIMVTAKRDLTDRVIGLDMGADDYITKPFEMEELLARVRSSLRRSKMDNVDLAKIKIKDLSINILTREVSKQGESIELTKKEYELLEYLANNKGIVLTRDQIINKVWGYNFVGDTNILDVYIKYLRNKIDYPYNTKLIQTVRGVGYTIKERKDEMG